MKDLRFKYDDTIDNWKCVFKEGLEQAGIIYDDEMISNMCGSLSSKIIKYLTLMGYRPNNTYSYRVGLARRLGKEGLAMKITTNKIFWKYLEYFTDIEDYSKCFNVEVVVDNIELATKDLIFVGVKTNKSHLEINQPTYSEEYAEITKKLDIIKVMTQNCEEPKVVKDIIIEISDILDYLIGRLD